MFLGYKLYYQEGFPGDLVIKNPLASDKEATCQCRRQELNPWVRRIPWRRKYSLQYSCLGNPMDRGSWWGHKRVRHDLATKQTYY